MGVGPQKCVPVDSQILELFPSVTSILIKTFRRKKKRQAGISAWTVSPCCSFLWCLRWAQFSRGRTAAPSWGRGCAWLAGSCRRRAARRSGLGSTWNQQLLQTSAGENINKDQERVRDRNPSGSYIFTSSIINCLCLRSGTSAAPYDPSPPWAVFSHSHRQAGASFRPRMRRTVAVRLWDSLSISVHSINLIVRRWLSSNSEMKMWM